MCVYMCIHIHIYVYIKRQRCRDVEIHRYIQADEYTSYMSTYGPTYRDPYTHIYVCIHIYDICNMSTSSMDLSLYTNILKIRRGDSLRACRC